MTLATRMVVDFAGSWPNEGNNNLSDGELIALHPEALAEMTRQNMEEQWEASGGNLAYISAGDSGKLKDWLRIPAATELRERLGLAPHDGQAYPSYIDKLRSASRITAEKIGDLGYEQLMRIVWPVFEEFRAQPHIPDDIKLRFGIATPYSWAFLAGFQYGKMDGFVDAVADEVKRALAVVPQGEVNNVLISFENPIEQVVVALASAVGLGDWAANLFAGQLDRVVEQTDLFFLIGLHPCWGDLNNEAVIAVVLPWIVKTLRLGRLLRPSLQKKLIARLQSPKNLCRHIKPLQKVLAARLKLVLMPLSAGCALPSTNPKDYRVLNRLAMPDSDVCYIAGVCHEGQDNERASAAAMAVLNGANRLNWRGFGPRCGLGRTDSAYEVMAQSALLCKHFA